MTTGVWGNGGVVHWDRYDPCHTCGVGSGKPCESRRNGKMGDKQRPHAGRTQGRYPDRCLSHLNSHGMVWFCKREFGHPGEFHVDTNGRRWRTRQPSLT